MEFFKEIINRYDLTQYGVLEDVKIELLIFAKHISDTENWNETYSHNYLYLSSLIYLLGVVQEVEASKDNSLDRFFVAKMMFYVDNSLLLENVNLDTALYVLKLYDYKDIYLEGIAEIAFEHLPLAINIPKEFLEGVMPELDSSLISINSESLIEIELRLQISIVALISMGELP